MRVAVHPSDRGGCGWYRCHAPAQALLAQDHDVILVNAGAGNSPGPGRVNRSYLRDRQPDGTWKSEKVTSRLDDADVLVVQRVVSHAKAEVCAEAQQNGAALVVDVDDDLDALPPGHPYLRQVDGTDPKRHRDVLHQLCALADMVTVSTPALADRYAPHGRVAVLENCVTERQLATRGRKPQLPLAGWTGRVVDHTGDASEIAPIVAPVLARTGASWVAWEPLPQATFRELRVPAEAQVKEKYRRLGGAYERSVARLWAGVVPLADSAFNRAKSWLKGVEYAAFGVPFVASPVPEYVRLAERGVGMLARSTEEWAVLLERLLVDDGFAESAAEANRAAVSGLTYELRCEGWWGAWTAALEHRRGRQAA